MKTRPLLALALDPSRILAARGFAVDPWQRAVLLSQHRHLLLNCCRQAGKSTVVSALAVHEALFRPNSLTLILSPGQRQSAETFHKVREHYRAVGRPVRATHETQRRLELANGARIFCLPGVEETVRGYSPSLVIIDEAARVADDLYRAVRPMLAVSRGRLVALSTPFGQRGWFYRAWQGDGPWHKVRVQWQECPRITAAFIAEEERALGRSWVAQEYECSFEARQGLVYPDFPQAVGAFEAPPGKRVGGIDWGWRNPFAAVWGTLDGSDVLWIDGERYRCETPLYEHARALPRGVTWYADPAGPARSPSCAAPATWCARGSTTSAWASPPSPPACAPAGSASTRGAARRWSPRRRCTATRPTPIAPSPARIRWTSTTTPWAPCATWSRHSTPATSPGYAARGCSCQSVAESGGSGGGLEAPLPQLGIRPVLHGRPQP